MGIYTEKRDQLIEKIKGLEKRIASDTAKKKTLEDKLKEVSRLAMAEEYNCKPRELDEIITLEHSLLQKLRASGLSDEELLKLVVVRNAESSNKPVSSFSNSENTDEEDDDQIYPTTKIVVQRTAFAVPPSYIKNRKRGR